MATASQHRMGHTGKKEIEECSKKVQGTTLALASGQKLEGPQSVESRLSTELFSRLQYLYGGKL